MKIEHDADQDTLDIILDEPAAFRLDKLEWIDLLPDLRAWVYPGNPNPPKGFHISDMALYQRQTLRMYRIQITRFSRCNTGPNPERVVELVNELLGRPAEPKPSAPGYEVKIKLPIPKPVVD